MQNSESIQLLERIKKLAEEKRGFIAELSRNTGIVQDKIYKWKDGKGAPKYPDMVKLKAFFEKYPNVEMEEITKQTADGELSVLRSNDSFFKNQYAAFNTQVLTNLNQLIRLQKTVESLVKINLEHTGNIEAHQKKLNPEVLHVEINKQILAAGLAGMDMDGHSLDKG